MKAKRFLKLALLEGEGLGTAYEYYVKEKLLKSKINGDINSVLVYGLPEKFGYSLDLVLFGAKLGKVTVVDDDKNKIQELNKKNLKLGIDVKAKYVKNLVDYKADKVDLVLSCEVVQRVDSEKYLLNSKVIGVEQMFFVPNGHNVSHAKYSLLRGLMVQDVGDINEHGYIDAPPFPPGSSIKKSTRKIIPSFVIPIISLYEKLLPSTVLRKKAHILWFKCH